MITKAISWLVMMISSFAPPDKMAEGKQFPGYEETADEKRDRYASIAQDLITVVYDPNQKVVFSGAKGRGMTAQLVLAIAAHESGFSKDVDKGPCYREGGHKGRCDGGKAHCMLQIHLGPDGKTAEGWTGDELFADRTKCFRAGMTAMRNSIRMCSKVHPKNQKLWLMAYAGGGCDISNEKAVKGSTELWDYFVKFKGKHPIPADDKEFMKND